MEHGYIVFPFGLSRQGGQAGHSRVPVEVEGSLHYHKKAIAKQVYLHLEYTYLAYAFPYLWPRLVAAVGLYVSGYQLRVVLQVERLTVTLYTLSEVLLDVALLHVLLHTLG